MYVAVAFDLDGTLLDTEAVALEAGLRAARRLGLPLDETHLGALIGLDERAGLARLTAWLGDAAAARAAGKALVEAALARESLGIPVKRGAEDVLARVGELGLPMAVVTSSRRARAAFKLGNTGLARHFSAVIALEDVTRPKPAPEPYLKAARALGADPARLLVFEDSEAGVASALGAGATVVQVPDVLPAGGRAHLTAPTLHDGARLAGIAG